MSTVFLVEDSRSQRQMIKALLAAERFAVKTAASGGDAIAQIQQHAQQQRPPDVVILDILMPDLNGYEVCRQLKQHPNTQNIPVIFCSSQGRESDIYWGFRQGAAAYVTKPFRPEDLTQTIRAVLASSSPSNQPQTH